MLAGCAQGGTQAGAPLGALPQAAPQTLNAHRHGWLSPAAKTQPLVYVSDNSANAIQIYPQGANSPSPIGEITDGISAPLGVFVDRKGTLYVANHGNNTVTEYPKGSTSPSVTLSSGISGPISVAADNKGDVAVGEFSSGEILEFPAGSSYATVTITLLSLPEALAFDSTNHLHAAWNVNEGSSLAGHESKCEIMQAVCVDSGIVEGESGGLVLDRAGNIVLGDQTNGVINIYAPHTTSPARTISMSGHDPIKFALNKSEKTLYVADIDSNTVLVYGYASGSQIGTISSGLESAWGVALSAAAKDGK
jgi:DNA-binding beta-propeller fold protein YncE